MENCPVGWTTVAAAVACTVLFAPASTMASSGVADPPNLTPAAKRQLAKRSDIETVFATSMVWRSASGEVLRTVPSRTG